MLSDVIFFNHLMESFLDRCYVKTLPFQMWNCVCFLFPSKKVKVFIDCSRDTDAAEEHVVADCNVLIWCSSLSRFSFCDVFMTSGIYIAFWPILYCKPHFFLLLNRLKMLVVVFTINLCTPSTPLQILVSNLFDFWCCKLFLWIFDA